MKKLAFVASIATAFCLVAMPDRVHAQSNSTAQDVPVVNGIQRGWLEGTVLNLNGQPVHLQPYGTWGIHVKGSRRGGGTFDIESDTTMGGLYNIQDLKPGVYDILLQKGWAGNTTSYRPQRIFGVIVKPGVRTTLNITLEEGDALQDIGEPAVTEQGLLVSQELARMQHQIDALKDQLKAVDQLRTEIQSLAQAEKGNASKPAATPARQ